MANILRDCNTYLRCYKYFINIIQDDSKSYLFLSNTILSYYSYVTTHLDCSSLPQITEEWNDLYLQFQDFIRVSFLMIE